MKQTTFLGGSVVLVLLAVASVSAHHSQTAIFDTGRRVAVTGTLTKVDWINPHIVVLVEARGGAGKVDHWTFESNPPSWYRSLGLARVDFAKAIGQMVAVEAFPARDGTLFGYMRKITLPDGTALELLNAADLK